MTTFSQRDISQILRPDSGAPQPFVRGYWNPFELFGIAHSIISGSNRYCSAPPPPAMCLVKSTSHPHQNRTLTANSSLLVKAEVDHDHDEPPRRVVVRPISSHDHVTVVRPISARSSARRISVIEPAPRPSQYVVASSSPPHHSSRNSIPRIVHAPSPPRSRERIDIVAISPRSSRGSVRSRHSTHSRQGSASHSRTRLEDDVRYITRRDAEQRGSRYLSASHSPEVVDSHGYVEAPRERLYLEEGRSRSRSITYATNPRISRERVLIEENGRRRESYRPPGSP